MNILKKVLIFILLFHSSDVFSQEKEDFQSIYTEFNAFFEKEIKHQGVKGNWIFGLKEITAYHKFDYNNDGLLDILIEFNAAPIDEGNYTNYYSVLFQNINNQNFQYVNYLETIHLNFQEYFNDTFTFENKNTSELKSFKLINSKFVIVK